MSKPHLYISPGPFLRIPKIIEALCRAHIPEPLFVQVFDFAIAGQNWKELFKLRRKVEDSDQEETVLRCCPKCFHVAEEFCYNPPEELRDVTRWYIHCIIPKKSKAGQTIEQQEVESA